MSDRPSVSRRLLLGSAIAGAALAGAAGGALAVGTVPAGPQTIAVPGERRRFVGKSVTITGATSGIGRATAFAFAREGANVAFCGRRTQLGAEVEAAIRAEGGETSYIEADVRDPASVDSFFGTAAERYGAPNIAFNNAGISFSRRLDQTGIDEWDDLMSTNLRGMFLSMRTQLPLMRANGGGVILVTSSANAGGSRPGLSAYNTSKRSILGLVQTAALEYAADNIRVNAICPGATDTPMIRTQSNMNEVPDPVWETGLKVWARQNVHALQRVATPDEMALAALSLCADDMSYLTGSAVFVDGGMTAAL
jgi:NAD(P)-dependent dehydrogenase (short-subunit alcohol dehydrogenase family)